MEKRRMIVISRRFGGILALYMRRGEPPSLLKHISCIVRTSEILMAIILAYHRSFVTCGLSDISDTTEIGDLVQFKLAYGNLFESTAGPASLSVKNDIHRGIQCWCADRLSFPSWSKDLTWFKLVFSFESSLFKGYASSPDHLRWRVVEYVKRL